MTEVEDGIRRCGVAVLVPAASTGSPEISSGRTSWCWPPIWLLDAVLQIQPFMFTRGSERIQRHAQLGAAAGNPGWVAHTITWNASNVYHHPIAERTPSSPSSSS